MIVKVFLQCMFIFFGVICTQVSVWAAEPLTDEEKIAAIMPIIFGLLDSSPIVTPKTPLNLAPYGTATQKSTYNNDTGASGATNAIDGKTDTFNHTNCQSNDWWQLELKSESLISEITVTNRVSSNSSIRDRLKGATIYLSNTPAANNTWSASELVKTLNSDVEPFAGMTFAVEPARSARYVIVKTNGSACLHMAEVAVKGIGSDTLEFAKTSYAFDIKHRTPLGGAVGTVKAIQYAGRTVAYSIDGSVPFAIDAQGNITVSGALKLETYTFAVKATDGINTVSVPVTVQAPLNLALEFGVATQSSTYDSSSAASNAIDGNLATTNHTNCLANDWWQVKLPDPTLVSRIVVTGRESWASRLAGAEVYVSANSATNGGMNAGDKVFTLAGTANAQNIPLAAPKSATYVIVKAAPKVGGTECLHMREVEVYGQAISTPQFAQASYQFLLDKNASVGALIGAIEAVDYQLNALTYTVEGNVPFAIDSQGKLTVSSAIQAGQTYSFNIAVSDGTNINRVPVTVKVSSDTAVQDALNSGSADEVTTTELLGAMAGKLTDAQSRCEATLNTLYPNGFKLKPDVDIGMLQALTDTMPGWIPWVVAKNAGSPKIYAYVKELPNGTRVVASGIPLFSPSQMKANFNDGADKAEILNLLKWLAGSKGNDGSGQLKSDADFLNTTLKITYHGGGAAWGYGDWYGLFKLPQWTGDNFNPTAGVTFTASGLPANWTNTSTNNPWDAVDLTKLADASQDIFMLGEATDVAIDTILAHAASGSPKGIYVQYSPPTYSTKVNSRLGIKKSGAWSGDDQLAYGDMPSIAAQCQVGGTPALVALVNNLEAGMPNFNYEATDCPNDIGTVKCDLSKVTDAAGNSVASLFNDGASAIRSRLLEWDYTGTDVFSLSAEYDFFKLAVLLGDKYRATTHYPMDKVTTDDTTFYQALFSDFAVHYARSGNHYQPDMGDFTDAQVALNVATTKTATRTYTPTVFGEWTSTGLYAPPGKVITVRRTDTGNSVVKLSFNFLRESTRLWNENKYSRPRYMSSPVVTIEKGKTYTFSTPYGGPIYLGWTGVETGATPFTVEITNVLDNPLLQAFDDASIQTFLTALEQTDSDWVDIKTPFAEIHSLKSYVLQSFASQDGDAANGYTTADVKAYIDDLNKYLIAGNYEYAGFTGVGLNGLNAEVSTFCNTLGLASQCTDAVINAKPAIQHVNADVNAACGGLCAGNPFDSGYPIDPLGWGENHEMGHNLQRARLKIYGGISSEVSNNIFPLHTQWRWTVAKGLSKHPDQDRPSNQEAFTILQNAIKVGTPANSSHPLWAGTGTYDNAFERLAFYIQLVYTQQFPGMPPSEATEKAWGLYTKLYLMERIFTDAIKTDAKWAAVKDQLGFGSYTRTEAAAINTGNDFMYVAASKIAGRNYSDYFAAWGIEVSDKAKAQVTANGGVGQVPLLFYYVNDELPAVMPTDADTIPLNGTSTWVDPTP